jgi:hypothetical protein
VGTEPRELDTSQEWELGEPLVHSLKSLPVQPGAAAAQTLWELARQVDAELSTVAHLEQNRHLTDKEHRQARVLRDLHAAVKEANGDNGAR